MKAHNGFSLLEVLIGVAVFMIGMVGVASLLVSTIKHNAFSDKMNEATFLAEGMIEALVGKDSIDPDLSDKQVVGEDCFGVAGLDCTGALADGSQLSVGKGNMYDVYWNIAENLPTQQSKTIKVVVRWVTKNRSREVSLQTIHME